MSENKNLLWDYIAKTSRLINGQGLDDSLKNENSELIIDREGNVSLNFKNAEVNKAFKNHLEVLSRYKDQHHNSENNIK